MKNIVLIGMPGCGKSAIGKKIAKKLNMPFYDADEVVVEMAGQTIPEMFAISEGDFVELVKDNESWKIMEASSR